MMCMDGSAVVRLGSLFRSVQQQKVVLFTMMVCRKTSSLKLPSPSTHLVMAATSSRREQHWMVSGGRIGRSVKQVRTPRFMSTTAKASKLLELWTRHPKDLEDSHRISGLSSQRLTSMQAVAVM